MNARSPAVFSAPNHIARVKASHGSSRSAGCGRDATTANSSSLSALTSASLVGEVPVDGADPEVRAARDVVHLGIDALLREHRARGGETFSRLRRASARSGFSSVDIGM